MFILLFLKNLSINAARDEKLPQQYNHNVRKTRITYDRDTQLSHFDTFNNVIFNSIYFAKTYRTINAHVNIVLNYTYAP